MNVFRGIILIIMAVTAKGDVGLKMTCPSPQLMTDASDAYCTVNVTRILETGCVQHDRSIRIAIFFASTGSIQAQADCKVNVDTGLCMDHADAQNCHHCHATGEAETLVYVTTSPSADVQITCLAYCHPRSVQSDSCVVHKLPLAVIKYGVPQNYNHSAVQMICPSARIEIPFELKCELYFSTLKERKCTTAKGNKRYPVVNVVHELLLGANITGITPLHDTRECQVELQRDKCVTTGHCKRSCELSGRDIVTVSFEYHAYYAIYGALTTSCRVICPSGDGDDEVSARSCFTRFTRPAYVVRHPTPRKKWHVEMRCPSMVPRIPYTIFCMVNVTQLDQDKCFKSGGGVHKVDLVYKMDDPWTVGNTTTCKIQNFQGIYQCFITPQCPFCWQQGKDMFYISFLVTSRMAQFKRHLIMCHTQCDYFFTYSRLCETFFTPGAGEP